MRFAPGRHTLRANNTLVWKTVEFEAEPGAHVHYTCVNRAPSSLYFMLFIFGVAPLYVVLRPGVPSAAPSAESLIALSDAHLAITRRAAGR